MSYRTLHRRPAIRLLGGVAAVAALVYGAIGLWGYGHHNAGVDFYQFWLVGRAAADPETGSVYDPELQRRIARDSLARASADPEAGRWFVAAEARETIEVFSTPLLYTAFGALATGDYEADYWRYRQLIQALTVLGLLVLGRAAGCGAIRTAAYAGLVLVAFEPLFADLRVLNVNQLQLALVVAYFAVRRWGDDPFDDLLGGLVLAVAVLFKPNLAPAVLLLVGYWIVERRWRTLGGHVAGAAVGTGSAVAASWLHFGDLGAWWEWVGALRGLPDAWIPVEIGNFALAAVIHEATGLSLATPLTVGLLVATLATLVRRSRKPAVGPGFAGPTSDPDDRDLRVLALGILVYLLGAGLVWQHYYLLSVPAWFLAAAPSPATAPGWWRWRWPLLAVAFLPHLASAPFRRAIASGPAVFTLEIVAGCLVLFVLLLADPTLGRARGGVDSVAR
jgi:hypothetical protein